MLQYYYLGLYFTRVKIMGEGEVANKISSLLSSLGYIISNEKI